MKKIYWYIIPALFVSLFIYLFFRTEKTLINGLFVSIVSIENYVVMKETITDLLPLHPLVIYSLPGGLWVFCVTLASKNLFLRIKNFSISLTYVPLLFAVGIEVLQLLHITNGTFDVLDIIVSITFWLIGNYFIRLNTTKQYFFASFNKRSMLFAFTYSIVHLAHVWQ